MKRRIFTVSLVLGENHISGTWRAFRERLGLNILPKREHTRVKCLPKNSQNGWNCCKARWTC
jgi:hypothetical protein